jgi:branched-chain amino acid transport system substrate-binding protein
MAVCGWDGMAAIFSTVRSLGGKITGDAAVNSLKTWKYPDSPRGPIAIDPQTRDVMLNVYINKVDKIDGKLVNVTSETIGEVKDPWKAVNPE